MQIGVSVLSQKKKKKKKKKIFFFFFFFFFFCLKRSALFTQELAFSAGQVKSKVKKCRKTPDNERFKEGPKNIANQNN